MKATTVLFLVTTLFVADSFSSQSKRSIDRPGAVKNDGDSQALRELLHKLQSYQEEMITLQNGAVEFHEGKLKELLNSVLKSVDFQNKTFFIQEKAVLLLEKSGQHVETVVESMGSIAQNVDRKLDGITWKLSNMVDILSDILKTLHNDNMLYGDVDRVQMDGDIKQVPEQVLNEQASTEDTPVITDGISAGELGIPTTEPLPRDCTDIIYADIASESGSHRIKPPDDLESFNVYCDMESNGGGWTVFQKRFDGSVNFTRNWEEYEHGFGDVDGEYWLGLKNIYRMISSFGLWELRIDMERDDGETLWAEYSDFAINDAALNYQLVVWSYSYSGNATDRLTWKGYIGLGDTYNHNDMPFTTVDNDNDQLSVGNCAQKYSGGWWFNACMGVNLNAEYGSKNMKWRGTFGEKLIKTEMKMRRVL